MRIGNDDVLFNLSQDDQPAEWQRIRLPDNAISVAAALPPMRQEVLGWLSAPDVAIYFCPAVVWRTPTDTPGYDEWWSGLPGKYIDLRLHKWRLTHWRPLNPQLPA